MHALWVLTHPRRDSLNHSLAEAGTAALEAKGTTVDLLDLHAEGWDPVLVEPGGEDVTRMQRRLSAAELVVFQFPLWWFGPPAILKGWLDRVFESGFAFDVVDPSTGRTRKYGDGGLVGRRALAIVTAGDRPGTFGTRGIAGHIDDILWPLLHGTFWYTGMAPLRPHLITRADAMDEARFEAAAEELRARIAGIADEEPIGYLPMSDEHYDHSIALHEHVSPGRTGLDAHLDLSAAAAGAAR